jgi:hypothetical protein
MMDRVCLLLKLEAGLRGIGIEQSQYLAIAL